jgi:hypothetical protein
LKPAAGNTATTDIRDVMAAENLDGYSAIEPSHIERSRD